MSEQKHTSGVISIDRYGAAWINGGRMLLTGIQIPASSGPRMEEAEANLLRMAECWNERDTLQARVKELELALKNKRSAFDELANISNKLTIELVRVNAQRDELLSYMIEHKASCSLYIGDKHVGGGYYCDCGLSELFAKIEASRSGVTAERSAVTAEKAK